MKLFATSIDYKQNNDRVGRKGILDVLRIYDEGDHLLQGLGLPGCKCLDLRT